jgi:hypothetical protein
MVDKSDSKAAGYLAAVLALKKSSLKLWEKFVEEMKRGNGYIPADGFPTWIGVDAGILEIMQDALEFVALGNTKQGHLFLERVKGAKEERRMLVKNATCGAIR